MAQGCTQEEVCAAVGVTSKTFIEWRKKGGPCYEEEFARAYEKAKVLQKAWWVKKGRINLGDGKDFNTPLFGLYMANMFGWRSGASRDDDAMQEIKELKRHLGIGDDV